VGSTPAKAAMRPAGDACLAVDSSSTFIAPGSLGPTDATLARRIVVNAGNTTSYTGLGSSITAGLQSKADLLNGGNTSGSDNAVTMQWRLRGAGEGALASEVVSLTGMVNDGTGAGRTDPYVLQVSYDPSLVGDEAALSAHGSL